MAFDFGKLAQKSQEMLKTAREKAADLKDKASTQIDRAAESAAKKVTDVTGRETTASEVKKVAAVTAIGLGIVALAASAGGAPVPRIGRGAAGGGNQDDWGGDVMGQAHRFFAENGSSLNIETHTVDMDGCILD